MANQVKIDLSVQDTGNTIKKRTSETQALNKELTRSQQLATGTRTGSGAVRASYSSASESAAYGQARGGMGATGAAGRDFANQAQGLGGLVRLYATYAANVFAVSAAFTALSQAMNTTNMVQGLNQLGAASGVSLGNLAKQFTEASGGAISLRESMESTAKAVSAGISQAQFLKLGEVAKQASQALGVNMSDAVSRLTRGIVKLEPELLDELGIFTKIGPATENYARSIGKSVDSLTDFERRQAFANAVLDEGAKKFGEIDIPTNPYDKLLASLKNVAQTILEVINKGLTPIIKLLSDSPNALTAAIGGLAVMLLKQALPAIGQYRQSLRAGAEEAAKLSEARSKAATAAINASNKERLAAKDAKAEVLTNKISEAESKLLTAQSGRIRKDVKSILEKTPLEVTDKDLAKLDTLGSKLKSNDNVYKQLAISIRAARTANLEYIATANEIEAANKRGPSMFSAAGVAAMRAESARKSSASKNIVYQAGDVAATEGITKALSSMVGSIKSEKLGLIRGGITGIAGAVNILGVAVSGAMTLLSRFLGWVGVAIGVYQLLDSVFSNNSKQLQEFSSAISDSEDAVKAAIFTNEKYKNSLVTPESILARATALSNLSASAQKVAKSFIEASSTSQGWFDKLLNNLKKPFGSDIDTKFKEQISTVIKNSLSSISDPKLRSEAEEKIAALTGASSIDGALTAIDKLDTKGLVKLGEEVPKVISDISDAATKAAMPLNSLKEGYDAIEKSYQELSNTLINKDPLTQFGLNLGRQASLMSDIFKDPINSVAALNDILKDTSKIKMFPPEVQKSILDAAQQVKGISADITASQADMARATSQIKAAQDLEDAGLPPTVYLELRMRGEGLLASATRTYEAAADKLNNIRDNVQAGLVDTVKKAFVLIEAPLSRAIAQANIDVQRTLLGNLPKTSETARLQTSLDLQSISLKREEISTTNRLINAIDLDRISREKGPIAEKMTAAFKEGDAKKFETLQLEYNKLVQKERAITDPSGLARDIKSGKEVLGPGAQEAFARNRGLQTQLAALSAQEQAAIINGVVATVTAGFEASKVLQERELAVIKQENQKYFESDAFRAMDTAVKDSERFRRTQAEQAKQDEIARLGPQQAIATASVVQSEAMKLKGGGKVATAAGEAVVLAQEELKAVTSLQTGANNLAKTTSDRNITTGEILRNLDKETLKLQQQSQADQINQDIKSNLLAIEKDKLQTQVDLNVISQESYRQQSVALDQVIRKNDLDNKLSSLKSQLLIDQISLTKEYNQAVLDGKETESIISRMVARSNEYNLQVSGAQRVYAETESLKGLTENLTTKQLAYADIFKNSFDSMADAMVTFAQTGKLSFSDLINTMIADIARFELRQMSSSLWQAFRPAIMGMFGGMGATPYQPAAVMGAPGYAKGGSFDYGIEEFAKGGAFTNSIVNTPTMFKFAKGTGLMGEAGPEAIMPLKRDSSGNLGVRSNQQQTNVDVVVNNYGTEKAETRETVDSRGNRKIEVIIGDMAAADMTRSGSASQRAVGGTYGLRPQLIRR
jgi:lambda family phage tail tape measure protein